MKKLNIEVRKLSELRHPDRNARMHPDKQIAELKRSLEKNEQTRLLVIDEEGVIWIGNGLYTAMLEMGYTEAYCIVKKGMSEIDKKKMMFSDNRIFDLGVDDMSAFDDFIAELEDFDVPGFDEELLETMKLDPVDVDEAMSMYGVVPDERKEEIKANAGRYDNPPVATTPAPPSPVATPGNEPSEAMHEPSEREYVICPKCGEKIWL